MLDRHSGGSNFELLSDDAIETNEKEVTEFDLFEIRDIRFVFMF